MAAQSKGSVVLRPSGEMAGDYVVIQTHNTMQVKVNQTLTEREVRELRTLHCIDYTIKQ